jgi:predicted anti-sigma-YlaC factor YlaD
MECKRIEALISPYLDGDLGSVEKASVETHLHDCTRCREMLALLREVSASLRNLPEVEISPDLQRRLLAIPDRKRRFRFSLDFLVRPALQPVLAAATVFLTLVSFYAFSPQRDAINKSIERQFHLGYQTIGKLYTRAESFTSSLAGYKDNLVVTLQNKNPLRREEE